MKELYISYMISWGTKVPDVGCRGPGQPPERPAQAESHPIATAPALPGQGPSCTAPKLLIMAAWLQFQTSYCDRWGGGDSAGDIHLPSPRGRPASSDCSLLVRAAGAAPGGSGPRARGRLNLKPKQITNPRVPLKQRVVRATA